MIMINPDIEIWAKWNKHVGPPNTGMRKPTIIPEIYNEKCRIEEYFKKHPQEKMCMLSCNCPKCTLKCA